MKSITERKVVTIAMCLLSCAASAQDDLTPDQAYEEEKSDETTESPRERGRVLEKLNPIASEHQVFGELGGIPGADVDGEGVDYRSYFNNKNPFFGPASFSGFSVSGNYNDLSGKSEFGGGVNWGREFGNDGNWFASFSANSNASDRVVEHYNSTWGEFDETSALGLGSFYLDRPRFSEDFIYTRNTVYKFELHKKLTENHRVYYKTSYQDYFDNFYRNRLELQFGTGDIQEDSVVIGSDGETALSAVSEDAITRRYFGDTDTNRTRQHHVIGGTYDGDVWSVDYSVYYHDWEIETEWNDWNFNDFDLELSYVIDDVYTPDYSVLQGPDLLETDTARFNSLRIHDTTTNDEDLAGRLDLERSYEIGDEEVWLQVGALYREKSRTNFQDRDVYQVDADSPFYLTEVAKEISVGDTIVDSYYQRPTGLDPVLGKEFFESNSDEFVYNDYRSVVESAAQRYNAFESVAGGYALAVWESGKWAFEVGGRYETTETNSEGTVVLPEAVNDPDEGVEITRILDTSSGTYQIIKDLSASNSYSNFLPSAEVEYAFSDSLKLRAAWFNSLMRPQYYNIVNYRRISLSTRTVSEGNPSLDPTQIEKARLALITESDRFGLFSFELYSIDVKDFFYGAVSYEQIMENDLPVEYTVSRVENGESGSILGFELQWKRDLDFMPFGENASIQIAYTYSDSESTVETRPDDALWLPERSEHLFQLDLTKRIGDNTTSLNLGYQSEALDDLGESSYRDEYREDVVSLTLSNRFQLNERSSVSLSVSGLLDHPERSYEGSDSRVLVNQYSSWMGQLKYEFKL